MEEEEEGSEWCRAVLGALRCDTADELKSMELELLSG